MIVGQPLRLPVQNWQAERLPYNSEAKESAFVDESRLDRDARLAYVTQR